MQIETPPTDKPYEKPEGERRMFEQLGIPIEGLGDGFSWKSQDLAHSAQLARAGYANGHTHLQGGHPGAARH